MKTFIKAFVASAMVSAYPSFAETVNIKTVFEDADLNICDYANLGAPGYQYWTESGVDCVANLFDGISESTDSKKRSLMSLKRWGRLVIEIPDSVNYSGEGVKPVSYTLHALSVGSGKYECAPTSWTLFGITPQGVSNELSTVTLGEDEGWTKGLADGTGESKAFTVNVPEGVTGYSKFVWRPLTSNSSDDSWQCGLMEFELLVERPLSENDVKLVAKAPEGYGSVAVSREPILGSCYTKGDITITYTVPEGRTFSRWLGTGLPEGTDATNPVLTFNLTEDVNVVPTTKDMWIIDTDTMTVSDMNDNWTLMVGKTNSIAKTYVIGVLDVSAILDGEGKLDLSTPTFAADGTPWVISSFGGRKVLCNSTIDGVAHKVYELILGGSVRDISGQLLNQGTTSVTNLVVNCPMATGRLFTYCGGISDTSRVKINCPLIDTLDSVFPWDGLQKVDVSDWNLPGVKTLSDGSTTHAPFSNKRCTGTLFLPRVEFVGNNSFNSCTKLNRLILGSEKTITSVGTNAFYNMESLDTLVLGGSPNGWKLKERALHVGPNLKRLIFLSGMPTLLADNSIVAENTTCIYVPRQVSASETSWDSLVSQAVSLNDSEKEVFQSNFPGQELPLGKLPAGVFGEKEQYIAYGDGLTVEERNAWWGGAKVTFETSDTRYGDSFEIFVNGIAMEGDCCYCVTGDVVTARATADDGTTDMTWHVRGHGLLHGNEISFTIDEDDMEDGIKATLWVHHPWTYLAAGADGNPYETSVITNRFHVVNVYEYAKNSTTRYENELCLGKKGGNQVNEIWRMVDGPVNLNGKIVDDAGAEWFIVGTHSRMVNSTDMNYAGYDMPSLYLPRKIYKDWGSQLFNGLKSKMSYLIYDCPDWTGGVSEYNAFCAGGNKNLKDFIINAPKAVSVRENAFIYNSNLTETDISDWDLSSVVEVQKNAFLNFKVKKGCLSLPSVTNIKASAFGTGFNVKELKLGTGYDISQKKPLAIAADAFGDLTAGAFAKVTFGPYKSMTIDPAAASSRVFGSLVFEGPMNDEIKAAVDNLLAAAPEQDDKQTHIYASPALGWSKVMTAFAADTEEEALAPEGVNGVYRDGLRKAWFTAIKSPYDPRGTIFIIR